MDRSDVKACKDLKDLIISNIRALYAPMFPSTHTIDVILYEHPPEYAALAIAYTIPGSFRKWKQVARGMSSGGNLHALSALWVEVQALMREWIPGMMELGANYEGRGKTTVDEKEEDGEGGRDDQGEKDGDEATKAAEAK